MSTIRSNFSKVTRIACLLVFASVTAAQDEPAPTPPRPCADAPALSQFDFWVGTWNVELPDGREAGVNTITKEQGGCTLVERWTSVNGGTGMSLNYFEPAAGQWVQNWVGADGSVIDIRGGLQPDGSMLLDGFIAEVGKPGKQRFRGRWTLLDDGRVRQHFELSDDGGNTWQDWFVGLYSRRSP